MKAFVALSVSQMGWLNSVDKWCYWKGAHSSLSISRCVVRVLNSGQSFGLYRAIYFSWRSTNHHFKSQLS